MKLGTYLKTKSISHADFAFKIGTTQTSVTRYVNGQRRPSIEVIDAIDRETKGRVKMKDWFRELEGISE
jgi:transcriptional regulator with XRE-family HTH domain